MENLAYFSALAMRSRARSTRAHGTLYYGHTLDILTLTIADESVNLVYLAPPFNSAQNDNAFFQEKDGAAAAAQIHAFVDTWSSNIESRNACDALSLRADKLGSVMRAFNGIPRAKRHDGLPSR